jgi:hypothetical protein
MSRSAARRYSCPSCHQKRFLAYGEWVEQCVLRPVPLKSSRSALADQATSSASEKWAISSRSAR